MKDESESRKSGAHLRLHTRHTFHFLRTLGARDLYVKYVTYGGTPIRKIDTGMTEGGGQRDEPGLVHPANCGISASPARTLQSD
jgi:hypothetical protein